MENKESIFNYIEKNIQRNGTLSEKFDLSRYRHLEANDLRFADGMVDYCFEAEKDDNIIKLLTDTMQKLEDTENNLVKNLIVIDNYYANNPKKTILGSIDELLKHIIEDAKTEIDNFSSTLIYKWSLYMMLLGKEIETVKIGIAIIGLFPLEDKDKIIEILEKLSLCEEFTKYTNVALSNVSNANDIRFRLAKKVSGYGKITLVEDLEPETDEIIEWLLCNGCTNNADNGWLATNIAKKINIPQMIHDRILSEDELEGLYNIVEAMIEEGPQRGISVYEQKDELFNEIAKQYRNFKNNVKFLHLLVMIKKYCYDENYNCEALSIINEIINSQEIKDFILSKIESEKEISEYVLISRYIENFEIYKNVYNVFKENTEQNMGCLGYLFEKIKNIDSILDILRDSIDLKKFEGDPEPIIDFGNSIDLISIIQYLENTPFHGEDFVIAGLKSKTMHPRNAALRTIINWKKITNKSIDDLPKNLKNEIQNLKNKEVIKTYKKMINEILEIDEDLSSYEDPQVIYGVGNEKTTRINLFYGDIDSLFADMIIERGKDYFKNKMIHNCEKINSTYISYVQGTDFSTEYKVVISINKDNEITNMECNCPYKNNCKHEYATLLHIRNKYEKRKENYNA